MDTHDVLNILGLLPVVGPVFDLCNAAYYVSEKDWGNAAMSLLFTIPGTDLVGTAAKISPYLGKFGKYVTSTAKFVKLVGTGTAAGVTAYQTGKKIANLIDTYATEGKDIDVNFFLQLGEIGLGLAATASFGKTLASDLEKYTTLNEKLEYAANAIKKEANRLAKDNSGAVKLPGKTIDGDDIKPSTSSDSSSAGKSEAGSASESGSETVEVKLSKKKYPESAQHIEDAIKKGQPDTLTIDRRGASSRRKASLKDVDTVPGLDRDEYPPAMSLEGGTGASVKLINPSDNRGSGSSIAYQLRKYPNGTKYRIIITEED